MQPVSEVRERSRARLAQLPGADHLTQRRGCRGISSMSAEPRDVLYRYGLPQSVVACPLQEVLIQMPRLAFQEKVDAKTLSVTIIIGKTQPCSLSIQQTLTEPILIVKRSRATLTRVMVDGSKASRQRSCGCEFWLAMKAK